MSQSPDVKTVYLIPEEMTVKQVGVRRDQGRKLGTNEIQIGPQNTLVPYGETLNNFLVGGPVLEATVFRELYLKHLDQETRRLRAGEFHTDTIADIQARTESLKKIQEERSKVTAFMSSITHAINLLSGENGYDPIIVFLSDQQKTKLEQLPNKPIVARLNVS